MDCINDVRGGGEVAGEAALRLRVDPGSLLAMSLGPDVMYVIWEGWLGEEGTLEPL